MRVVVFFDLPTETSSDLKEYRRFRKLLINEGFLMMQESVYTKLALNKSTVDSIAHKLRVGKPKAGLVQMLVITEKQFAGIEYIVGDKQYIYEESDERLIIV